MKLREEFRQLNRNSLILDSLEKITDDFSIRFVNWVDENVNGERYVKWRKGEITTSELLKIYKETL